VERVEAVVAAIKSLVPDRSATIGAAGAAPALETSSPVPERPNADSPAADGPVTGGASEGEPRLTLAQKMRAWLGRAA
jgi:8-oxo-dGTP diphosphatase